MNSPISSAGLINSTTRSLKFSMNASGARAVVLEPDQDLKTLEGLHKYQADLVVLESLNRDLAKIEQRAELAGYNQTEFDTDPAELSITTSTKETIPTVTHLVAPDNAEFFPNPAQGNPASPGTSAKVPTTLAHLSHSNDHELVWSRGEAAEYAALEFAFSGNVVMSPSNGKTGFEGSVSTIDGFQLESKTWRDGDGDRRQQIQRSQVTPNLDGTLTYVVVNGTSPQ